MCLMFSTIYLAVIKKTIVSILSVSHGLLFLNFSISRFYRLFVHIIHIAKCHCLVPYWQYFLLLTINNITVSV